MVKVKQVKPSDIPMSLLLEADPDEAMVLSYLESCLAFVLIEEDKVAGACLLRQESDGNSAELMNIAIWPDKQKLGLGSVLLEGVLTSESVTRLDKIWLKTGTFGHQLSFYQRQGFRVERVVKNYFVDNYPEPIYENGIQHQDMLILELKIN
ncbi:acrtyltransferase [Vibrio ishigakensis]|uniref:Acrtyltransferase n=1 Tax=Vibrio ishigakensis TaxID=1481914 RepID=A0A0B8NPI7_9VIBR|nr:GNAT family N-acetyltransferase [Vibrio ishigakensis]GAM54252.1 acrtyltransferase [Vibrio ishigakensis]